MTPRQKLIIVSLVVILANAADLGSTYAVSPDLAREWNILQRHFGLGWIGLLSAKLVGICLAVAGYAYYQRFRDACYPPPGRGLHDFCRYLTFGREGSQERATHGLRHLLVNLGYFWAAMQVMVFWVAFDNLLLRFGIMWEVRNYSEMGYHLGQSAVVACAVLLRFYVGNYARYRELGAVRCEVRV